MVLTFTVAEHCSVKNAWLLSGSSQPSTAGSMYLYISTYHLTALSVSGELSATVLPSASNSLPPNAHSTGKLVDLPSPGAWPSDMPIGLPYAFIFCAAANSSSNVSGNLGTPAALKKSGRQFHAAGAWPS